jgi:hypothetical protein
MNLDLILQNKRWIILDLHFRVSTLNFFNLFQTFSKGWASTLADLFSFTVYFLLRAFDDELEQNEKRSCVYLTFDLEIWTDNSSESFVMALDSSGELFETFETENKSVNLLLLSCWFKTLLRSLFFSLWIFFLWSLYAWIARRGWNNGSMMKIFTENLWEPGTNSIEFWRTLVELKWFLFGSSGNLCWFCVICDEFGEDLSWLGFVRWWSSSWASSYSWWEMVFDSVRGERIGGNVFVELAKCDWFCND